MGLPGKSKGKSKGKGKQEAEWKKIGSLWSSKEDEDRLFATADDYNGELYWKDNKSEEFYKVKFISLFEPKKKDGGKALPKNLHYNLAINLLNDEAR